MKKKLGICSILLFIILLSSSALALVDTFGDVRIESISAPSSVNAGEQVPVTVRFKNYGSVTGSANLEAGIFSDTILKGWGVLAFGGLQDTCGGESFVRAWEVRSIAPGETAGVTLYPYAPSPSSRTADGTSNWGTSFHIIAGTYRRCGEGYTSHKLKPITIIEEIIDSSPSLNLITPKYSEMEEGLQTNIPYNFYAYLEDDIRTETLKIELYKGTILKASEFNHDCYPPASITACYVELPYTFTSSGTYRLVITGTDSGFHEVMNEYRFDVIEPPAYIVVTDVQPEVIGFKAKPNEKVAFRVTVENQGGSRGSKNAEIWIVADYIWQAMFGRVPLAVVRYMPTCGGGIENFNNRTYVELDAGESETILMALTTPNQQSQIADGRTNWDDSFTLVAGTFDECGQSYSPEDPWVHNYEVSAVCTLGDTLDYRCDGNIIVYDECTIAGWESKMIDCTEFGQVCIEGVCVREPTTCNGYNINDRRNERCENNILRYEICTVEGWKSEEIDCVDIGYDLCSNNACSSEGKKCTTANDCRSGCIDSWLIKDAQCVDGICQYQWTPDAPECESLTLIDFLRMNLWWIVTGFAVLIIISIFLIWRGRK